MKSVFNATLVKPLLAVSFLAISIIWLAGGFNSKMSPGERPLEQVKSATKTLVVSTMQIPQQELIAANITPMQDTEVSSRIIAQIATINVRAGQRVKQGDLLITLEQSELLARVKQSQQQKNAVSARLVEAQKLLARAKQLHQENLLSAQELDKSQANVDALSAEEQAAQEALNQASSNLSFAKLHAPIDGVVIERLAEPGNTAQPGVPLLTIYNPSTLQVEAYIREQLAVNLTVGDELIVNIPSIMLATTATIAEIVPAANIGARSFLVKANITTTVELKPGMYATLSVEGSSQPVVKIPQTYVNKLGQLDIVLVKTDGVVSRRFVQLGQKDGIGQVEVISGLADNEEIVLPI